MTTQHKTILPKREALARSSDYQFWQDNSRKSASEAKHWTNFGRLDFSVFAVLALVMLLTRTHSLSNFIHVPDTSWASFFVAGYFIRSRLAFPALFGLGFTIDVFVIYILGGSSFCFTPAYWMLLPAYGVMWCAGRLSASRLEVTPASVPALIALVCLASAASHLLSSGGFYFLSGRFPEPSLAGFLPRLERYFPVDLMAALSWISFAFMICLLAKQLGPKFVQTVSKQRPQ